MIAVEHECSFVDYHKSFCCHNTCRYLNIKATTIEHLRRRFDRPVKSQDVLFLYRITTHPGRQLGRQRDMS